MYISKTIAMDQFEKYDRVIVGKLPQSTCAFGNEKSSAIASGPFAFMSLCNLKVSSHSSSSSFPSWLVFRLMLVLLLMVPLFIVEFFFWKKLLLVFKFTYSCIGFLCRCSNFSRPFAFALTVNKSFFKKSILNGDA